MCEDEERDEGVWRGRKRRMKMCGRALQCREDNGNVQKGMEVSTGMAVSEGRE